MVWLTGLLIALLVLSADFVNATPVSHVGNHVLVGMLCLLVAPGFAFFQSRISVRRWAGVATGETRFSAVHGTLMFSNLVVWLFGCLALMIIARWPQVVRGNWGLGQVPLLDELVLVAPMLASVLVSWLLIFDAERAIEKSDPAETGRFQITWQRCKTFCGLVLVPIASLFLARDLLHLAFPEGLDPVVTGLFCVSFLLLFLILYPSFVSLTWKTRPLPENLKAELLQESRQAGLLERVAVWDTGSTMANAVVVGMVPKLRRIFLTDQLLEKFETDEIRAVYRHELGHLAFRHLQMRMALLLVPLVAAMGMAYSDANAADGGMILDSEQVWVKWCFTGLAFFFYLALVMTRFVRRSEIEADLFAIQRPDGTPCRQRADAYCRAMFKMAALSPDMFRRSTLAHPSIGLRLEVIRQVLERPELCARFHRRFLFEQHIVAIVLFLVLVAGAVIR